MCLYLLRDLPIRVMSRSIPKVSSKISVSPSSAVSRSLEEMRVC